MSTFRHNGKRRYRGRWIEDVKLHAPSGLERTGRRIARTLGVEELLFAPLPEERVERSNGDLRDLRRVDGRWMPREHVHRDRHRLLRLAAARAWYLIIPVVGLAWANAAYVRPAVESTRSLANYERQMALDTRDDTRAEISRLHSQDVEISARIDTLHVPQIMVHQVRLDSLTLVRRATERNPEILQARLDSLRAFRGYLLTQLHEGEERLLELTATQQHLAQRHETVQDSLAQLEQLLTHNTTELDRREGRRSLHGVVSRFWYLVAPVVGMMWAHES
ncbi:MAG: hypothetical protein GF330_06715 [Candidatus Eisenbacteria bacterium]|nr:hypothetical protein [Candidatus Eisenbacteria bacterium]